MTGRESLISARSYASWFVGAPHVSPVDCVLLVFGAEAQANAA